MTFQRPINRYAPALPVKAMETYAIKSPRSTHTRPATCEEVGCKPYLAGWITVVPKGTQQEATVRSLLGRHAADGLVRHAKEETSSGDTVATFRFEAGQPCFRASTHRVSLERPELYLVRGGDWRANTGLIRRHTKPEHWVENMQETLDAVARRAGQR